MNEQLLKKKYEEYIKLKLRQKQIEEEKQKLLQQSSENKTDEQPTTNKDVPVWKSVSKGIKDGMSNNTLYVTSFNKAMYDLSGVHLLKTWVQYNPKQYLLVCYEDMKLRSTNKEIIPYDLSESEFLKSWLKKYENDIPFEYGGKATPQNNPDLYDNYFNKSASKWFRKIVSIDYAIKTYGRFFNHVVWIDADCYIKNPMPKMLSSQIFKTAHMIYHLSPKRRRNNQGIESGIIGFRKGLGYDLMEIVTNKFKTGEFKKYSRWDDGWIFREVVDEQTKLNKKRANDKLAYMVDLVITMNDNKSVRSEVIPYGPYGNFVVHDKGKHNELRGHKIKKKNYNKGFKGN